MRSTAQTALPARFPLTANGAILTGTIVAALYFGSMVFVPLALAVLLSFVLSPLVQMLRKLRVPRGIAVGVIVTLFVAAITLLGMAMARQVTELANDLPRYESTLRQKLKTLRTGTAQSGIVDRATATLKQLSRELDQKPPGEDIGDPTQRAAADGPRPIPVEIHQPPERPLDTYQRIVAVLIAPLTTTGVVLLLMIFILLQREDIRDRVIRLVGPRDLEGTTAALNDAASRLSRLFLVQTGLNVAYGAIIALGLWLIGVPSPLLWGIVATLMRFVPYVGAVLAAVFPVLLAASVDPGWSMVVWTLSLYVVLEPIVGHLIEPWVHGATTGLSPLAIVVSAVLWTALWGPIGLLLATPLTMCLVVLGRHVEGLTFLDIVLGDQPALSPPEIFYQRLLAGSSAEAAEQADEVLATTSLIAYFDDVAFPGLQLAAADAHRGAIDTARMAELQDGVSILLEDLSEHPLKAADAEAALDADNKTSAADVVPVLAASDLAPAWRSEMPPVLCIGARTPLDLAAAQVLAQLVARHGIPARVASSARLSDLSRLDLSGVKLVWLSSIDASQAHAHLRFVLRRLRRSGASFAIYGGYWDGTTSREPSGGTPPEAFASDLRSAVKMTIKIARDRGAVVPTPAENDQRVA